MEEATKASVREVSASCGCAVSIETGDDGKLIISVDIDTIAEALSELVSWGDISEEDEGYISTKLAKAEFTLVW